MHGSPASGTVETEDGSRQRGLRGEEGRMMKGLPLFLDSIFLGIRSLPSHQGQMQGSVNSAGVPSEGKRFQPCNNTHVLSI